MTAEAVPAERPTLDLSLHRKHVLERPDRQPRRDVSGSNCFLRPVDVDYVGRHRAGRPAVGDAAPVPGQPNRDGLYPHGHTGRTISDPEMGDRSSSDAARPWM